MRLHVVDEAFAQLNGKTGHLHQPVLEDAVTALQATIPILAGSERYGMALRDMSRDLASLSSIASSRAANKTLPACRKCQR